MPQLGEAIAEAVVVSIDIAPAATVSADQEVMQVETDKTVMGVTVPCKGTVAEITVELGKSYPVGSTLGYLDVSKEDAAQAGAHDDEEEAPAASGAKRDDELDNVHFAVDATKTFQYEDGTVRPTVGLPVPANATGATYMSPRMKARMQELGLNAADLSSIAGTGAGGRVTVEDFERFLRSLDDHKTTPASHMRIAVADSMRRSWYRPLATVGRSVLLDRVLVHRKSCEPKPGPALYLMRALALAIAENTAVAGRLIGERIVHPKAIDLGFAVEVPDGVLVPVIREVDKKPLKELVHTYNHLVAKARERRLPPEAVGTGIATVSNFGTFGLIWATPIPLPEQNLIFGLGAGRKNPVWSEEVQQFIPATEAEITLSFDHRVLDGGAAGRLVGRVADLLQQPETL